MGILDDIKALGRDPRDPNMAAASIQAVAADPNTRMQLIREWETATGETFPDNLRISLVGQ